MFSCYGDIHGFEVKISFESTVHMCTYICSLKVVHFSVCATT